MSRFVDFLRWTAIAAIGTPFAPIGVIAGFVKGIAGGASGSGAWVNFGIFIASSVGTVGAVAIGSLAFVNPMAGLVAYVLWCLYVGKKMAFGS